MSSGLITLNLQGEILSFNRAAEAILGYKEEEIKGRLYKELFPLREDGEPALLATLKNFEPHFHREEKILTKEGREITIGVSTLLLKDEKSRVIGVIGIFSDLTLIKQMEEQIKRTEKLSLLGELAAGIAHEIRNPLTSISGSIQMLAGDLELTDYHKKLMQIIVRESERLNEIITQFLDYARSKPTTLERHDIDTILDEVVMLLGSRRDLNQRIKIRRVPAKEGTPVLVDSQQIKQVFVNLSINAFEAMPAGGILTIKTAVSPPFLIVEFIDTGVGIPPEELNRIFDPFYTTKEGGTGLGLSVAQRIIENHGGTIEVKSELNKGTTFRVKLPLK